MDPISQSELKSKDCMLRNISLFSRPTLLHASDSASPHSCRPSSCPLPLAGRANPAINVLQEPKHSK